MAVGFGVLIIVDWTGITPEGAPGLYELLIFRAEGRGRGGEGFRVERSREKWMYVGWCGCRVVIAVLLQLLLLLAFRLR